MNALLANLYLLNGQRDLAIPCVQRAEREMRALRGQKLIHPDVSGWYIECAARFGNRDEVEREIEFLFVETRDHQWLFPYSNVLSRSATLCWATWTRPSDFCGTRLTNLPALPPPGCG